MIKILIPVVFVILGVAGGAAAGIFIAPKPVEDVHNELEEPLPNTEHPALEYARFNNQFLVPVVDNGKMNAMMVLTLSVEVPAGMRDKAFEAEPKIRDSFLSAMLEHAAVGGFSGDFTRMTAMDKLRERLKTAGNAAMPELVNDVLILEIARQEL